MQYLVFDIGGTAIKYAWMDAALNISDRGSVPTPREGRKEFLDALEAVYRQNPEIGGIAISIAGIVDTEKGYISMGGALEYNTGFPLKSALFERCPVPIYMENDAKCAAMAEASAGSLRDVSDGLVLTFGTMIGGGVIHGHRLYRGSHGAAGEVSYLLGLREGLAGKGDVFGNRCGVPRLCRDYAAEKRLDPASVDGRAFFEAANAGDEIALRVLRAYAHEIAIQVFNLQTTLDPQKVAIGGGISAQPLFVESIREELRALYAACPYNIPQAQVVTCKFRNDANLYGALSCLLLEINR